MRLHARVDLPAVFATLGAAALMTGVLAVATAGALPPTNPTGSTPTTFSPPTTTRPRATFPTVPVDGVFQTPDSTTGPTGTTSPTTGASGASGAGSGTPATNRGSGSGASSGNTGP